MEQILSDHDRAQLDQRVAEAEKRTKAQIMVAVIKRSDAYAELPWKAFAMAVSVAGLLVVGMDLLLHYRVSHTMTPLFALAAPLAVGAAFALLTVLVPKFARLFLSGHRAEVEVRQYAESLFLNRELFATEGRTGILLLVSLFERQVILLPDKGISGHLTPDAKLDVIASMTSFLALNDINRALEEGLERLTRLLESASPEGVAGTGRNEVPDEIIEEKGV